MPESSAADVSQRLDPDIPHWYGALHVLHCCYYFFFFILKKWVLLHRCKLAVQQCLLGDVREILSPVETERRKSRHHFEIFMEKTTVSDEWTTIDKPGEGN